MKVTLTFDIDGHSYRQMDMRLGDSVTINIRGCTTMLLGYVGEEDHNILANHYQLKIVIPDCDPLAVDQLSRSSQDDWSISRIDLKCPPFSQSHFLLN